RMDSGRHMPDHGGAMFALGLAVDMLQEAREMRESNDYHAALEDSRDAIRIACSAIMLRDGYVTDDFDKTVKYLLEHYDSLFPVREWERVEMTYLGEGGLYNMLMRAMGRSKKTDDELVNEALSVAEKFISAATKELG